MTRNAFRFVLCLCLPLSAWPAAPSPYAGQESRDIKALSPGEVADYLAGKGMGLAKAAELNGYPGPAHVLELAAALELTAEQRSRTESLFARMQSKAAPLGRDLVEEERALDRMFASRAARAEEVSQSLARIARLSGELRNVHLQAHLEQVAILLPSQVERYNHLRGYASAGADHEHEHRHQ